ncbi:MAG: hypothetical protein RL654_223 [Pseudomonadota bacterium]|jgi:hypothetical protein
MNIGDDISNLLRQIGPEAGIYQDVSKYNAARGGQGRRGLFGRTQPAPLAPPAESTPVLAEPAGEETAPETAPAGVAASLEIAPVTLADESFPTELTDIRADPAEISTDATARIEARCAPAQAGAATPVASLLQAPVARTEPAPTLVAEVPATPARPTSLSSLARRLSGDVRPADGLDLSALGESPAGTSREPAATPTQRLDRLFDRLASSLSR